MCGICGSTQDPEGRRAAAMQRVLIHRGPDDEGCHVDPSGVSLAVRRLSIIDAVGGRQPIANEDGSILAVLNGEIYNHHGLRHRLLDGGHRFRGHSDTEVLVHLYEEYGDDLVHAVEGMFAMAIWDAREQRLLLARDRFGEKPLFYAERGGVLTFASELSAVRVGAQIAPELVPSQVDAFFVFGYVPGPLTIVKGIEQLPPGHVLSWTTQTRRAALRRYWAPPLPRAGTGHEPIQELTAEARRLLERSVVTRMAADVPVGLMISGGIDSTLVAAIAAEQSHDPVRTYTVGYDVGTVDETGAAREIARTLGTRHREITLTQAQVADRVPAMLRRLDQPLADQALVSHEALSEAARAEVTVLVGGDGADELFGGYPRYLWIERGERLRRALPGPVTQGARRVVAELPPGARVRRLGDVLSSDPMLGRHVDWVTWRRRHARAAVYGPRLRSVPMSSVLDSLQPWYGDPDAVMSTAGALMHLDQGHWLPDDVLMKADRGGMLQSVESRTPYLHRDLVEFLSDVGTTAQLGTGGKRLVREVAAQVLPSVTGRLPKRAFRVPAAQWLRGPLAPSLKQLLATSTIFSEGWFDHAAVRRIVDTHLSGREDHTQVLWPILTFGLWHDELGDARD